MTKKPRPTKMSHNRYVGTNNTESHTLQNNHLFEIASRQRRSKPTEVEIQELRHLFSEKWYTVSELRQIEKRTGKHFKRGKFSHREKEILRAGLNEYLSSRNMTMQDFVNIFFTSKTRSRQVYQDDRFGTLFRDLTQRLDGRPILLTYQCVRRMFHPGNLKGTWSLEEDEQLQKLFVIHGPDWETIGKFLDRYGMSCRDRYKLFRGRSATGPWNEEETKRLLDALHSVRNREANPKGLPCWLLVSEAVGTRSVTQCQIKWISLSEMLFSRGQDRRNSSSSRRFWTEMMDYYLVCRIYEMAVEHESELVWSQLFDYHEPIDRLYNEHDEKNDSEGSQKLESINETLSTFHPSLLRNRWKALKKRIRNQSDNDMDNILERLMLLLRPLTPDLVPDADL